MTTGLVTVGRTVAGRIVCAPPWPMSNAIVFEPGSALASRIAWRNDPGPLSSVVVTRKVESNNRSSRGWREGRKEGGPGGRLGRLLRDWNNQSMDVTPRRKNMVRLLVESRDKIVAPGPVVAMTADTIPEAVPIEDMPLHATRVT